MFPLKSSQSQHSLHFVNVKGIQEGDFTFISGIVKAYSLRLLEQEGLLAS